MKPRTPFVPCSRCPRASVTKNGPPLCRPCLTARLNSDNYIPRARGRDSSAREDRSSRTAWNGGDDNGIRAREGD